MNSYQTANAAFAAAGLRPSEGVKHGRGYFFRRSLAFNKSVMLSVNYGAMPPGVLARVARDLQLDYHETKMSNGRAEIPRRDYGAQPVKYLVVQARHNNEDVYYVARHTDLSRVTFYTTEYENAVWWAKIRNSGQVQHNKPTQNTDVMRNRVAP